MKERRKDLLWEMVLILLTVAACLYSTGAENIFGAKVDWSSQHSVFPEYFRQQFYRTGQFFPEFALNIGGGQNIYNFSYYGLFSPVVFIGYILPNVKISDYIIFLHKRCKQTQETLCSPQNSRPSALIFFCYFRALCKNMFKILTNLPYGVTVI